MPVTPLEPSDPQHLGDFVLTGRLGAGGMGVVYLGQAPNGDLVAVKLVRADLAHDSMFRDRFRREVEALRRVSGPRVAQLLAADTEAPQPYLVVEFVDGPTLADAVATEGPIAGPRLRALAAALAEAIVVIHEVGVIHRDLKPNNVILAADQPKLVDFGIAAAAGSLPLTVVGTIIGSAGWMAPEQAAGEVSTPAVDVFTWGSLVAFAGTGRPPFGTGGPEEVTSRIRNGRPDLEGLPQEVRPFVEAAFLRDPALRPSAKAVLAGLVGRSDASTDELVEETTHLIENTWVLPVDGWPVPPTGTPPHPPTAPPAASAPPPPVGPPPARRRVWPIVLVVALAFLLGGVAAAMLFGGADQAGDGQGSVPSTTPPPTAASTIPTTTTAPPVPVSFTLTVPRDLFDEFGDLFDPPAAGEPSCPSPDLSVAMTDLDGEVEFVPDTAFPDGERIAGGAVEDCRYTIAPLTVPSADVYVVFVSDSVDPDFDDREVTASDLAATNGEIDLGDLFGLDNLFGI